MIPRRVEALLERLLRHAAQGHAFLLTCAGLACAGTLSAAYPVTAVVVPAALLAPRRWPGIAFFAACGSTLGGTALVILFHHLGWAVVYEHFPQFTTHPQWLRVMDWVATYGVAALFVIAASPLPQTPALIVFGITRHDIPGVLVAMLAGKLLKYGLFALLAARFPERFNDGIEGFLRWRRGRKRNGEAT